MPLSTLTTFRIGGPAAYFIDIRTLEDIPEAVAFAESKNMPICVIGAGSNLLISDQGLNAVVVKISATGIQTEEVFDAHHNQTGEYVLIVRAGERWDDVVRYAVDHNLGGIENLSLIPGLVGAAAIQNIGAYGVEIADVLDWVEAFDIRTHSIRRFTKNECQFAYRHSFFKTKEGKNFIITQVAMRLVSGRAPQISYKDLAEYFSSAGIEAPAIREVRQAVIAIRTRKLPDPAILPNAGSFFKNPVVSEADARILKEAYPLMPAHAVSPGRVKISAAWLIDHVCNMRGVMHGDAGTFERQPLVIVNRGAATASDIQTFSEKIAAAVKEKTNIDLEREVELVSDERVAEHFRK